MTQDKILSEKTEINLVLNSVTQSPHPPGHEPDGGQIQKILTYYTHPSMLISHTNNRLGGDGMLEITYYIADG